MSTKTRKRRNRTKGAARYMPAPDRTDQKTAQTRKPGHPKPHRPRRGRRTGLKVAVLGGLALAALGAIFFLNNSTNDEGTSAGAGFAFAVGSPGPGEEAPPIRLVSTGGGTFDLAALRGQTVLLYFQEGLMCPPCWDQLRDIEAGWNQFQRLGIDRIVAITTDPIEGLMQRVADEGLSTPVLSDPSVSVSAAYDTNSYGMMGQGYNGHSFIVVDPDGTILWRADYGGAPNYTMYLPVSSLVADLREGLTTSPS